MKKSEKIENPDCKGSCSKPLGEATKAIHVPYARRDAYDALSMPVYNAVAFEFDNAAAMTEAFSGRSGAPDYSRTGNPTVTNLEDRVCILTGAKDVTAFNSGMAAISNALLALTASGKNVVTSKHLFGNTYSLLTESLARFGVETRLADLTDAEATAALIDENTACVYFEIITNPQMEVADIQELANAVHQKGSILVADTTTIPFTQFSSHDMFIANKMGVKNVWFYAILGIGGVWTAFLMSGVHATISAVLSAFMIPADSKIPEAAFISRLKKQLHHFEEAQSNDVITLEKEQVEIISKVKETSKGAVPALQRLEHGLHPFVAFCIMPIFALSNAGVNFIDMDFSSLFSSNVIIGVLLGLLLGKPIGILLSTWVLTKLKLGNISKTMTWRQLIGIGFLASIGFTMSMFVTALAFTDATHIIQAKVGIFSASIIGGTIGYLLLRSAPHYIKKHQ